MKVLFFSSLLLVSAGGKPLDHNVVPKVLDHDLKLLLESQRSLRDQLHSDTSPNSIVNDLVENEIYNFDPEYALALSEIDRRHSLYKLSHRDLQWKTVVEVMRELDNDARVDLITNVRRYPLHKRLPPTVAITPTALNHWQTARSAFLNALRKK